MADELHRSNESWSGRLKTSEVQLVTCWLHVTLVVAARVAWSREI